VLLWTIACNSALGQLVVDGGICLVAGKTRWEFRFRALRENSWKSTPIEGVAGNLVIQQERPSNETVAKSRQSGCSMPSFALPASPIFGRLPPRGEAGLATYGQRKAVGCILMGIQDQKMEILGRLRSKNYEIEG
jgi:hypothetical protein